MADYTDLIFNEQKIHTKQIPLFEEQDDGNLVPYEE